MNKQIQFAAELDHVREVSLLCTADLAPWEDQLRQEGLAPVLRGDQVQVLIVAAASKFMGLSFRELSISLRVRPQSEEMGAEGAFLVWAFNSCRLFAFCERFLTETYPFLDLVDSVTVGATERPAVLRQLRETHFVGREWSVRADAVHAKSKTYARSVEFLSLAGQGELT